MMQHNTALKALDQDPATWRALTVFNVYRVILALILCSVFFLQLPPEFIGEADPKLYKLISLAYLVLAFFLFTVTALKFGHVQTQIRLQLVIDIIALTMIIHSSGGINTGLGSLMLVVVVAGGALIPGRLAIFIAALASLAILFEVAYMHISSDGVTKYNQAGILGATFFVTAWLAQWLSKKIQTTQVVAEQHRRDVENMAVLNQHIISRMKTGVIALDTKGAVTMLNESARTLLGINQDTSDARLADIAPELAEQIWLWQHHSTESFLPFQSTPDSPEIKATAASLDSGEVLVYIENTSALAQEAQQLKLASLGRLTASIAHEIRNPLAAISHAGELLAEQQAADPMTVKLTDIILRHSLRVNSIIETILEMSRRKTVEPSLMVLANWLEKFINEFKESKQAQPDEIIIDCEATTSYIAMDPEQLYQVLWNLLDNAWFYSTKDTASARITLVMVQHGNELFLDVFDNGPGVADDVLPHLFEPFHSLRKGGTGLGLYLARELCQANGARLNYIKEADSSGHFRISFAIQQDVLV
ncbi:hypothetical protein LCGC14_0678990 [marine sediment metagenome]|uniref:histidine kinase n=1 Tax=marine sediment metagenome TaxID=412755 RepID=A0A0F9TWS4_9ZZZZ